MHVKLADFIRGFVVHAPVSCHLPGTCRAGVLPFLCPKHRPSVGQLCSDNIAAPTRRDSETTGNSEREIRESWPCPEPWQSCRDRNTEASGRQKWRGRPPRRGCCVGVSSGNFRRTAVTMAVIGESAPRSAREGPLLHTGNDLFFDGFLSPCVFWWPLVAENVSAVKKMRKTPIYLILFL